MNRSSDIDISVTIAPELRHIMAVRHNIRECGVSYLPSIARRPELDDSSNNSNLLEWRQIRLRRDGAEPITFLGVEVLAFCRPISISGMKHEQDIALYLNEELSFFVSMRVTPPSSTGFRPWCFACVVNVLTIGPKLKQWATEISAQLMHTTFSHPKVQNREETLEAIEDPSGKELLPNQI